jgi:hypothetical protein
MGGEMNREVSTEELLCLGIVIMGTIACIMQEWAVVRDVVIGSFGVITGTALNARKVAP